VSEDRSSTGRRPPRGQHGVTSPATAASRAAANAAGVEHPPGMQRHSRSLHADLCLHPGVWHTCPSLPHRSPSETCYSRHRPAPSIRQFVMSRHGGSRGSGAPILAPSFFATKTKPINVTVTVTLAVSPSSRGRREQAPIRFSLPRAATRLLSRRPLWLHATQVSRQSPFPAPQPPLSRSTCRKSANLQTVRP
jgi:hypothetical protein